MRKITICMLVCLLLTGCDVSENNYRDLEKEYNKTKDDYSELSALYEELKNDNEHLIADYEYVNSRYEELTDHNLQVKMLSGWGITVFGNAEASEVDDGVVQIVSTISDTSDVYIKTYNDRLLENLPNLGTICSSSYVDCEAIFIKVVSEEYQPVIEYAIYPSKVSTDFMISTQFLDVLENLVD